MSPIPFPRLVRGVTAALLVVLPATALAQGEHVQSTQTAASSSGKAHPMVKTHEDLQPTTLPPLPAGMSIATIVSGDSIFHGKGGCFACHGQEAEGLPAAGDALTVSLNWAQYEWKSIDSLITAGIPQTLTRSPMQMPAAGGRSDLTPDEVKRVAAYVWAISQVRGEPWPGGHASHAPMIPMGATTGTATKAALRRADPTARRNP